MRRSSLRQCVLGRRIVVEQFPHLGLKRFVFTTRGFDERNPRCGWAVHRFCEDQVGTLLVSGSTHAQKTPAYALRIH